MRRLAMAALVLLAPASTHAQAIEPGALASCMQANTTAEDEAIFRRMLIAALQENDAEVKASLNGLALAMLGLGTQHCGINVTDFDKEPVQAAMRTYGERLGENIMKRAFAKAGL